MSDKERVVMSKLAEALEHMDEEDKNILIEKADSMAYMNRKYRRGERSSAEESSNK